MIDKRFFDRQGPFAACQLVTITGAEMRLPSGYVDSLQDKRTFTDVAALSEARTDHVSFFHNRKYLDQFCQSNAGACLVQPDMAQYAPPSMILLLTKTPHWAYAQLAQAFYPTPRSTGHIHAAAIIDPSAMLADDAHVEAGCVIGPNVELGCGSYVGANTTIDAGVVIGTQCVIGANVSISHTIMGSKVVVHPGARIGQEGFGFAMEQRSRFKVPQLGRVIIGDDVEIGANTTIDRGSLKDTRIKSGVRIDNLVQIAHNVKIGEASVLVAQVGVAGSTEIGKEVMLAGQAGVTGHLKIGNGARVAAQAGVMRSVQAGAHVMGSPARPVRQFFRGQVVLDRLVRARNPK